MIILSFTLKNAPTNDQIEQKTRMGKCSFECNVKKGMFSLYLSDVHIYAIYYKSSRHQLCDMVIAGV